MRCAASFLTGILAACQDGDEDAFQTLIPLVYDELRRIAHRQLRCSRPGATLNTTALVHEAYLKLSRQAHPAWGNRSDFFAISACAMRQIVVDYARRRCAEKRGGGRTQVMLDDIELAVADQAETMVMVDEGLRKLGEQRARLVRVVECRLFAGLSEEETAQALAVSPRTVRRDWLTARTWLQNYLR